MKTEDYNYELPKELIAQEPVKPRSASKLLVINGEKLEHKKFKDITNYLEEGDVLVLNETKVVPAKLIGKKSTGAKAEIIITAKQGEYYKARIATNKPRPGNTLIFEEELEADILKQEKDIFYIKFNKENIEEYMEKHGKLPTPPYIQKELEKNENYQTVYAKKEGSVAAPTAGFHFTPELLQKIQEKGIKIAKVTLHVGFGTFLPIITENIEEHNMEEEYYEITKENSEIINNCKGKLIAVGTTTLKTLETASDENGKIQATKGWSNTFIKPGYKFKTKIKALITNFHTPKSTLLLLVCAFAGKQTIFNAYKEAVKQKYRFYSFGDATLLFKI
jgi:S-adenosylmethionine:tRNA ribosyltransferase-isomerase